MVGYADEIAAERDLNERILSSPDLYMLRPGGDATGYPVANFVRVHDPIILDSSDGVYRVATRFAGLDEGCDSEPKYETWAEFTPAATRVPSTVIANELPDFIRRGVIRAGLDSLHTRTGRSLLDFAEIELPADLPQPVALHWFRRTEYRNLRGLKSGGREFEAKAAGLEEAEEEKYIATQAIAQTLKLKLGVV